MELPELADKTLHRTMEVKLVCSLKLSHIALKLQQLSLCTAAEIVVVFLV